MGPEVFSAASVVVAACVTGFVAWHSSRDNREVQHFATLLEGYDTIVKNLQAEVVRLSAEVSSMKAAMDDCESRSFSLQAEIEALREQVTDLGAQPVKPVLPAVEKPKKRTPRPATATRKKK